MFRRCPFDAADVYSHVDPVPQADRPGVFVLQQVPVLAQNVIFHSAHDRSRTCTPFREPDSRSGVPTNSTTRACVSNNEILHAQASVKLCTVCEHLRTVPFQESFPRGENGGVQNHGCLNQFPVDGCPTRCQFPVVRLVEPEVLHVPLYRIRSRGQRPRG